MGNLFQKSVEKPYAVIAIDFGTSCTGYAFSYANEKDKIYLNDNWHGTAGQFFKTPTSVLYDKSGNFAAFGFESEREYFKQANKCDMASKSKPSLYRSFKMQLYTDDNEQSFLNTIGCSTIITSEDKKEKLGIDVFSDALKYIKKHALDRLAKNQGGLTEDNMKKIQWVVTVPAIWKDKQKVFMREACVKAGLIAESQSKNLMIALEPECASLYCKDLQCDKFNIGGSMSMKLKEAYMVVDLGGGTVDITVHKHSGKKDLEEVHHVSGGPFGGNQVNIQFEKLLASGLGEDFISYLKKSYSPSWFHLMSEFERQKQTFTDGAEISFVLSGGISDAYDEFMKGRYWINKPTGIKDAFNASNVGISLSDHWYIVIDPKTSKLLFSDVIHKIYELVYCQLSKPNIAVSHVFLVGGFADCSCLQNSMERLVQEFESKPKLLVPMEASLCVLRGAVKYGYNPYAITSRVSRCTYAILSERDFVEGQDNYMRKQENGRVKYLDCIIEKGQRVKDGKTIDREIVFTASENQTSVSIYTSTETKVDDPNAKSVSLLSCLELHKDKIRDSYGKKKVLKLYLIFGGTELHMVVLDKDTNKEVKATFTFQEKENNKLCLIM